MKQTLLVVMIFFSLQVFAQSLQIPEGSQKLTIGGYGEVVYQHFDYTSNFNRYTYPELYAEKVSRGQTDIPHLVFMLGYNFGKGWRMNTEIEYEHGGVGAAVEIEAEEFGEYEQEIEKGGEVVVEQFWLEKSFNPSLNVRMGHIIVPVGITNLQHLPTQYFTVLRPEGEMTILPCTWHENGVSIWGISHGFRYEFQVIGGLDVDGFGSANWIQDGAGSTYEYTLASNLAAAARIDYSGLAQGLRVGASGYYGRSAKNSLKYDRYSDINGDVAIVSADAEYIGRNLIVRGNFVYGNIQDTETISSINRALPGVAPSPHTDVAKNAMCYSASIGYNVMSIFNAEESQLYPFVRYDYYDSMHNTMETILDDAKYKRQVYTIGLNYFPMSEIVLKAEYGMRVFDDPYNQENTFSMGVMFSGFFWK